MQRSIFHSKLFPPSKDQTASSPYRLDEGFSEDIPSGPASPISESVEINEELAEQISQARTWLLSQPAHLRAELACELIGSLPNSVVSEIIREANGRLRFDPVTCLPQEIVLHIFSELDFESLLNATLVSAPWRTAALQPQFWRTQFRSVGWTHKRESVRSFEENSRGQLGKLWANSRTQLRSADSPADRPRVKRQRSGEMKSSEVSRQRISVTESSLEIPGGWPQPAAELEVDLMGKEKSSALRSSDDGAERNEVDFDAISDDTFCPLLMPSRIVDTFFESPRFNWHWLYKQRHRLEQNWNAGRCTHFRLPHPDFPQEAHKECVYTLQFSKKYVVSGSRDKSVRVWDLETKRLRLPPLVAHKGSVLCLQFDETPSRDLIVSGSSDSDVIIWKFSTGEIIKRLSRAHHDSVLNLQFDDRYLVTCSKDHTIKLWNMRDLLPSHPEYPQTVRARNATYPDYIVNIQQMLNDPKMKPVEALPKYSLLMTFKGHGAAVNAIHMRENFIVSASGDRRIMLWNIKEGALVRVFSGHTKGIACVQFDGRRIVSGGSDNTVRIFDSATGAEVATLDSHRHLVRTVQAEFGDTFGSEESDEAEARENDRMILDVRGGSSAEENASHQKQFVFGAKLPPGGGGNRWSKIVSGSYDQTVMLWRRDRDGNWKIRKALHHEHALRFSASSPVPPPEETAPSISESTQIAGQDPSSRLRLLPHQRSHLHAIPQAAVMPTWSFNPPPQHGPYNQSAEGPDDPPTIISTFPAAQIVPAGASITASLGVQHASVGGHTQNPNYPTFWYNATIPAASASSTSPTMGPNTVPGATTSTNPAHGDLAQMQRVQTAVRQSANALAAAAAARDMSRVFKLQFDARRIISSSSMPIIVGWDFANGDRDIEEASQFFGDPA